MNEKRPIILFKFPSRGRPEKFFIALDSIVNNIVCDFAYHISCTLDEDDKAMNNDEVRQTLSTYKNLSIGWGKSTSKVDAINRDMPEIDWDILVNFSDDMLFNFYGFDEVIRQEMMQNFPDTDGYLHFPERDSMAALCVLTICGRKYYDRFGYIYNPEYKSLFCDNEQMEVAKILGKYIYLPYMIFEHRNPAYAHYNEERDAMFNNQQQIGWTIDQQTFNRRKAINFGL